MFGNTPSSEPSSTPAAEAKPFKSSFALERIRTCPTTRASPRETLLSRSPTMTSPSSYHPPMRAPERTHLPRPARMADSVLGAVGRGSLQAEVAGIGKEAAVERDGPELVPGAGFESGLVEFDDPGARGSREYRGVRGH